MDLVNARGLRRPHASCLCFTASLLLATTALAPVQVRAQEPTGDQARIEQLLEDLDRRVAQLEEMRTKLNRQERELQRQRDQILELMRGRGDTPPSGSAPAAAADGGATPAPAEPRPRQRQVAQESAPPRGDEQAQPTTRELDLSVIRDRGGVLTPAGTFIFEPELEFSTSDNNRFFFDGVEVVEAVLFGIIEVTETRRESLTAAANARYGVTDRFEVDLRVPYTYRNDRVETTFLEDDATTAINDIEGFGLGDIEVGAHYQINDGREGWPVFVGNLSVKAPTGEGPFEVDRDQNGFEDELPTGSGFWTVEPSITAIVPADPAVIFGNIGYAWNLSRDVDETLQQPDGSDPIEIGEVDAGDSISVSFGTGFALNRNFSLSLGYEHVYVLPTETEINDSTVESNAVHIASFLVGGNYSLTPSTSLDLRLGIGLTEEAPDARVTFRVPIAF
jgi:hypothetical protein